MEGTIGTGVMLAAAVCVQSGLRAGGDAAQGVNLDLHEQSSPRPLSSERQAPSPALSSGDDRVGSQ